MSELAKKRRKIMEEKNLILREQDDVVCRECYGELLDDSDMGTWRVEDTSEGECSWCGEDQPRAHRRRGAGYEPHTEVLYDVKRRRTCS